MKYFIFKISVLFFFLIKFESHSQSLKNASQLDSFSEKLRNKNQVVNILFLGDSHIQAGFIPEFLREKFCQKYGYAGRGLVFPYTLANSNGPSDFSSVSNQAWETFRLVYDQDIFPEMGALGFVMGNQKDSFIEINFKNPRDAFDEVIILNDHKMKGDNVTVYDSDVSLSDYITKKKTILDYRIQEGDSFPEIAAKFNTITTRLVQLNGEGIKNPKNGQTIKVENVEILYDSQFETKIKPIIHEKFNENFTVLNLPKPTQNFLFSTNSVEVNLFFGFQFLKKNATSGIVFNSIGVNGAAYSDFLKYPLQMKQLKQINPDIVIISLGTNESLSNVTKEDFQKNVKNLVETFRTENLTLPVVLISPTDNKIKSDNVKDIVKWLDEASIQNNVAFINMYEEMGGKNYFKNALNRKEANADGVHFLKPGYEKQAEKIWNILNNYFEKK